MCIAAASKAMGTVAAEIAQVTPEAHEKVLVEYPAGVLAIQLEVSKHNGDFKIVKAGTLRTARKLLAGDVYFQAQRL